MKLEAMGCKCDRCNCTTGRCFSYTTMHPGRPDDIWRYDICSRCNDDFDVWIHNDTSGYIQYHKEQDDFTHMMFALKNAGVPNYIEIAQKLRKKDDNN